MPVISKHDLWVEGKKEERPANKTRRDLENLVELIMTHAPIKEGFNTIMYNTQYSLQTLLSQRVSIMIFSEIRFCTHYTNDNIPFTTFIINRDYVENTSHMARNIQKSIISHLRYKNRWQ